MSTEVLAIAHRGASGILPENTKHAFIKAMDLGAHAIELDVQLTRDEVPVVIHDDTLDRTTNGKGRVAETDFDVVSKLDAGSWFGASFTGVEIPTLDEVLTTFGGRITLNIELKPGRRVDALVKHVITVVARRRLFDSIVFSSFNAEALRLLRHLVPPARIGVLSVSKNKVKADMRVASELRAENFHPRVSLVDSDLVWNARARGWKLWAWTANSPGEIALLAALGVDGIFTDYPDRVATLAQRRSSA